MRGRPDLIEPQDLKYVKVDPDSDFDPEKNKEIIDNTIKWTDRMKRQKMRDAIENVKERTNATATFAGAINKGGNTTNRDKFFGKKYLAYLRGYEIMEKIKGRLMLQGRDKLFEIVPSVRAKQKARSLI